jgi:cytochrome c biogenesis protein
MKTVNNEQKKRRKTILDFLSSNVLAIVLLAVIGLLAFTGTLIPQGDIFSAEEITVYDEANPAISFINRIVSSFQIAERDPWRSSIYAVYHSWWFALAILMLAVNLASCTLRRFGLLKNIFLRFDGSIPHDLKDTSDKRISFNYKYKREELAESIRKWSSKKFRIREEKETAAGTAFRFQKGRIGRIGYIIVHIGILIVIIGAMISGTTREKGYVWLREGEATDRYYSRTTDTELPFGFTLKAERLQMVMNKDGKSVHDWYSELTVIQDGKISARKTIQVNDPMTFEDRSFYQSSWSKGYTFNFIIKDIKTGESESFPLSVGNDLINTEGMDKTYSFKDGRVFFRLQAFYPDFILTSEGFATRSQNLNNPAAVLLVYWNGLKEARRKVIFSKLEEMEFSRMHPRPGDSDEPFHFSIDKNIKELNVTGIEISTDKGTNIVYVGFYLVIIGVFMSFYFNHRRVWVLARKTAGGSEAVFIGAAHRNKQLFSREFKKVTDGFKHYISGIKTEKRDISNSKQNIKNRKK